MPPKHHQSGGSAHQRAVKQGEDSRSDSGTAPENKAVIIRSANKGDRSKDKVLSRSSVEAYVFFGMTILLTVIPMTWWLRGLGLICLIPLAFDFIWRSPYTHKLERPLKIQLCVAALIVMGLAAFRILPPEYKREHPPKSALAIAARAQNILYPKNTKIGGIEWKDEYGEVHVPIENGDESWIRDIDIYVEVDQGFIFQIGHDDDINNVEFHAPDDLPDDKGMRLSGADGSSALITFRDLFRAHGTNVTKEVLFAKGWNVFCPHLARKGKLQLILATSTQKVIGPEPNHITITGSYRRNLDGENQVVEVHQTVAVVR